MISFLCAGSIRYLSNIVDSVSFSIELVTGSILWEMSVYPPNSRWMLKSSLPFVYAKDGIESKIHLMIWDGDTKNEWVEVETFE